MNRNLQISLAKRLLAHAEASTTEMAPAQMHVPVSEYLDARRWQQEIDQLHKRLPVMACLSSELPEAGSFLAFTMIGVPILLTRDDNGTVQAFLNVCRHRGAAVAPVTEHGGTAKRFSCPYHGWTYDNQGRLLGVANAETFGSIDRQTSGLTPLQADERAGLVFVVLTPGLRVDIDDYLAGAGELIGDHAAGFKLGSSRQAIGSNWKLMAEGHLESYHFSSLHRNSIGPSMVNNCATVDRFGPHVLITFCGKNILSLRNIPEEQWEPLRDELINPQFFLFPSTTVTLFDGVVLAQIIRPGDSPGRSTSRLVYAQAEGVNTGEAMLGTVTAVVQDEDYKVAQGIFAGMSSGAQSALVFGRNEPGPIAFHEALRTQMAKASGPCA